MCEVHATQKRRVCVGAESVNKKLVIRWFREVNITELGGQGNNEKEATWQVYSGMLGWCLRNMLLHFLGGGRVCVYTSENTNAEKKNCSFTARSVTYIPHSKCWLFSTFYLVVLFCSCRKKNILYPVTLKPRLSQGKAVWKDLTGRGH